MAPVTTQINLAANLYVQGQITPGLAIRCINGPFYVTHSGGYYYPISEVSICNSSLVDCTQFNDGDIISVTAGTSIR